MIKAGQNVHGLDIPGKLHRGFSIKTAQYRGSLLGKLNHILNNLSSDDRRNIQIFVTGHSQGAALAHLAGVVVAQHLGTVFPGYDNKQMNQVQIFRISAPRVIGNRESYDYTTRVLGKHNDIRQNVQGDPVPNTPAGSSAGTAATFLSGALGGGGMGGLFMRAVAPIVTDPFSDYLSTGYLAYQLAHDTIIRNISNSGDSGLYNIFASLHLGSTRVRPGEGAFFDPKIVDLDTPRLLLQGKVHQENRFSPF